MEKIYFVTLDVGYAGMTAHEKVTFESEPSEKELAEYFQDMANEHAQSYGLDWCPDDSNCDDSNCEFEYHDGDHGPEFSYEEYDAEKHDMYIV